MTEWHPEEDAGDHGFGAAPRGELRSLAAPDQTVARCPRQDGLFMPARWVEHERTLVSWPCLEWAFATGHLEDAKAEWAEVICAILRFEPVTVIAAPGHRDEVVTACGASVGVAFRLLGELFPGREVVGVPTDVQAYGGGGIGCITQQVPAGTPVT